MSKVPKNHQLSNGVHNMHVNSLFGQQFPAMHAMSIPNAIQMNLHSHSRKLVSTQNGVVLQLDSSGGTNFGWDFWKSVTFRLPCICRHIFRIKSYCHQQTHNIEQIYTKPKDIAGSDRRH